MTAAALEFIRLSARGLFAGRRGAVACFLLLIPPLVALVVALVKPDVTGERLFRIITFLYSLRFMIFLLSMIFGMAITTGEIEEGTAGYLYLGALPRWAIVLLHILTTTAVLTLLCGISLLLTALASGMADGGMPHLARDTFMTTILAGTATLVTLGFYVTCGLVFKRPLAVAVTATFLWELLMSIMPVAFAAFTVTNNIRALMLNLVFEGDPGRYFHYIKNFELPDYGQATMFLSPLAAAFMATAMIAAMNRSIEGREARD